MHHKAVRLYNSFIYKIIHSRILGIKFYVKLLKLLLAFHIDKIY